MYLSDPFLILPSAPTITGAMVVLRCHIFSISISRSLYLLILIYIFDWYIIIYLALPYHLENMFFFYIVIIVVVIIII